MKFTTLLVLFLVIGGALIYLSGNYSLTDSQSRSHFLVDFSSWSVQLVKNFVHVTMFAIKQPWLPKDVNVTQVLKKVENHNVSINQFLQNNTSNNSGLINVTDQ